MKINTPQQAIERFHLLFLFHLGQSIDKQCYILKGGCNLRFFMKSIRYSEDIDLDIQTIASKTLEKNVDKILNSSILRKTLQANEIALIQYSKPKQTETTQRWKILLQCNNTNLPIPTKIEFSRRGIEMNYKMGQVDPMLLKNHSLFPVFTQYYCAEEALAQKIIALALRGQTQCRDIFDIHHLTSQGASLSRKLPNDQIQEAIQRCLTLSFGDYKAQVVAYLERGYWAIYDSEAMWTSIQLDVLQYIEGLLNEAN